MEINHGDHGFAEVKQALLEHLKGFPNNKQAAANDLGVSRVFLWRMIEGKKPVSDHILTKIGFKKSLVKYYKYERTN